MAGTPDEDVGDAVGALLVTRVQERLDVLEAVRLTVYREARRGRWDRATRRRLRTTQRDGAGAVVDGVARTEVLAEQRWLAWFPRPFGPHHAVNVASPVVDWVARRCPGVGLVRVHLAARSWQAEMLQAAGTLARTDWGRRRIDHWVERGSRVTDEAVRWACLVEATAGDDAPVRAWAWGRGPHGAAAALAGHLPGAVEPGPEGSRTTGPTLPDPAVPAGVARGVLDTLAGARVLRWSVADPGQR